MKDKDHIQKQAAATPLPTREGLGGEYAEPTTLLHAILDTLEPEEAEALRRWREADPANEALYQQTLSTDFLAHEYQRRQAISHERPLADMQRRIAVAPYNPPAGDEPTPPARGLRGATQPRLWLRAAAVLAFVLLAGALSYIYIRSTRGRELADATLLQPGQMHAFLTGPDGITRELTGTASGLPESTPSPSMEKGAAAPYNPPAGDEPTPPAGGLRGATPLTLTTPRGGEFRITLEDGTEVWLNAQSRLVYPETFAAAERRVQVEGEAYFRVAPDAHKPFIVETDGQLVRVLGTEFNIRSYAEDATVQTTLVSGAIAMQPVGAGQAQLQLTPGHQAVFDKSAHDINVRSVDTEVVTGWRDGRFVFENQTLEQIMLTLSRWYDFSYRFADRRAAHTEFMGSIPRYSDFADVIAILESSGGLRLSVKGRNVTIESKHN